MRTAARLTVAVMLAWSTGVQAADYPKNEIWLGLGGAKSFEKSVLNAPNDFASAPEGALSFGFLHNLDARSAIGFHVYGAGETSPGFPFQGGSQALDLGTVNMGLRYRYAFTRGAFVPYLFAGANAVGVSGQSDATGDISGVGASACAGPGVGVRLGRHFMLSAEGIASFGNASWEKLPTANSSSKKFDPSLIVGTVNLGYAWGTGGAETPAGADSTAGRGLGRSVGEFVLFEALVLLLSAPAYADDKGGSLAGVTAATALLGAAAGASSDPSSFKVAFFGLLSLAAVEFGLGRAGATDDALFMTSLVGWNVLAYTTNLIERKPRH